VNRLTCYFHADQALPTGLVGNWRFGTDRPFEFTYVTVHSACFE
jgi:hypothetical protein